MWFWIGPFCMCPLLTSSNGPVAVSLLALLPNQECFNKYAAACQRQAWQAGKKVSNANSCLQKNASHLRNQPSKKTTLLEHDPQQAPRISKFTECNVAVSLRLYAIGHVSCVALSSNRWRSRSWEATRPERIAKCSTFGPIIFVGTRIVLHKCPTQEFWPSAPRRYPPASSEQAAQRCLFELAGKDSERCRLHMGKPRRLQMQVKLSLRCSPLSRVSYHNFQRSTLHDTRDGAYLFHQSLNSRSQDQRCFPIMLVWYGLVWFGLFKAAESTSLPRAAFTAVAGFGVWLTTAFWALASWHLDWLWLCRYVKKSPLQSAQSL